MKSIFRALGMKQAFVAGGQDIPKTFKVDRKFIDLKKVSGMAAGWKDWSSATALGILASGGES